MYILKMGEITGVDLGIKCVYVIFCCELTEVEGAKKMIVHFGSDLCWGFEKLKENSGFWGLISRWRIDEGGVNLVLYIVCLR